MKTTKKVLTSKRKIRFQHCDPFNHLNNAKYIDYFINAREDQLLEHYDLDIYKYVKETGKAWVIADHQISYFMPAYAMEEVSIDSQLIHYTAKSITIEMKMYDDSRSHLKAMIWTTYVLMDLKTKRTATHDEHFLHLFESVLNPVAESEFSTRIKTIKTAA